jgi:hypothetical protein
MSCIVQDLAVVQLLFELKSSCGDALDELLTACPGQSLSVQGIL